VRTAARAWGIEQRTRHPELVRLGVFGSYARGEAGVGSDLDLVAVVRQSSEPFERRAVSWDLTSLPVPSEVLVYTEDEWDVLLARPGRFAAMLRSDVEWIV
jgi:predicted nucleotidyltransferase